MTNELAAALLRYTQTQPGTSPYSTAVDGLLILRSDHPAPPTFRSARPALCIVAQGAKWASFGGAQLEYRAGQALVVGVETPSRGRVFEASPDKPCLVLILELDLAMLRAVAKEMSPAPVPAADASRGVFVANFDGPLAECALRAVRLLDTPDAIGMLYPMLMREICYWLLSGPNGSKIARLASTESPSHSLLRAVENLRARFAETVRVEDLAAVAQLSASAFHRQFKALTGLPPLQYQKQLRLLEARRLLLSLSMSVQAAAFEVGYESASQFSREYTRMFGAPPKKDSSQARALREAA
ncbi:AraC family transcriptional regulator [Paraburkholderia sp. CNPSo 3076]|uniref:AraC family transcriptional regulator n=1 Tax=Paraburkholderia sp. CNPSo 3076 TaxID=2940936 RepID=UPI00225ADF82|nr:AraC family transcriptional regulator [Paraburkholderia sp. CNPSo 3076]MCX5541311.1 AraC family transcriptional regulator [Paraburkholderia sp. CNPSo 3076]